MQRFTWLMGGAAVVVALWAPLAGAQTVTQDTSGAAAPSQSVPPETRGTQDTQRGRSGMQPLGQGTESTGQDQSGGRPGTTDQDSGQTPTGSQQDSQTTPRTTRKRERRAGSAWPA